MSILQFIVGMALMGLIVNSASGQDYPNKPVRIVTAEAGGSTDLVSRIIAPKLALSLGQQVIVDNRGGATGARAAQTVAQASPDGYTLLLYSSGLWLSPLLRATAPFDPDKDFSSITIVDKAPNVLIVHPSVAANSVKELIVLIKAKPGDFSYGSGGVASSPHLAGELFKSMARIGMVHIPYKGGALAVNATISGEVQLSFPTTGAVAPHLKSGRVRALAVTSAQPSALVPGLPTMAASGLPAYESTGSAAIFSTAATPSTVIKRLNQEIVLVLNQADVKERFLRAGVEVISGSPQQLTAYIKSEIATMGKVIKDAGITGD